MNQQQEKQEVQQPSLIDQFENGLKKPQELDQRYRPTQQQIDIVTDNLRLVISSDTNIGDRQLFTVLYGFNNPKDLILLFLVNTCQQGLKTIEDEEEQKYTLYICCQYFKQLPMDDARLFSLSHAIFDCVLDPIVLWENHNFVRIWTDLVEYSTIAVENRHNDENFPLCMSELAESIKTK